MSVLTFVMAKLKASPLVIARVPARNIHVTRAPQGMDLPFIVIHKISEDDPQLLAATSQYPNARLSFECNAKTALAADDIGEALKLSLQDVTNQPIDGVTGTFLRTSTDVTGFSDAREAFQRIIDFYCRFR